MGATYRKRGTKSWLVTVHHGGHREYKTVRSEADAKALVQHIHKQELAGTNVIEAIRQARAITASPPTFPKLRDALPEWIDGQAQSGGFRHSTAAHYRQGVRHWLLPALGDVTVDKITREQIGAVILTMKSAGLSSASIGHVRYPLKVYFDHLIEMKTLPGPNPAGDLRFFLGKRAGRKAKATALSFFEQEEAPALIAAAKAEYPHWAPFILTGLPAGLRWARSRRSSKPTSTSSVALFVSSER